MNSGKELYLRKVRRMADVRKEERIFIRKYERMI